MTWWNWSRTSPLASMPSGQWMIVPLRVPPQWDATCFVHWNGVSIACAQPTEKWLYASGVPAGPIRDSKNSGVSSAAAPLKNRYSLKLPLMWPSADAPLSPMM